MQRIDLTSTYQGALRLARLRRRAKHFDLKLSRSRWHQPHIRNRGGLILLNSRDEVVAGEGYGLDLASVERILTAMADQSPPSAPLPEERMGRG